jgi:hypothetical protein
MVVASRRAVRVVRRTLTLGMLVALAALTFAASATASSVGGSTTAGSFVIGDGNATIGTSVTFWGAQWWTANSLSGGLAPAAFKGFANTPETSPACGTNWSTRPGNSSGPPPGPLPELIEVIVASHIAKSGPTISGDTAEVVVVNTNPGYAPDPGHAGTGTVVAVVCGSSGGGPT